MLKNIFSKDILGNKSLPLSNKIKQIYHYYSNNLLYSEINLKDSKPSITKFKKSDKQI